MISGFSESDQRQLRSLPIKSKQNVTQRAFFGKNGIELTAREKSANFCEQRLSGGFPGGGAFPGDSAFLEGGTSLKVGTFPRGAVPFQGATGNLRLSRNPAPFGTSADLDLSQMVPAVYN